MELLFPVVGHSFLPCDRVFGNIEKSVRKEEVIVHPDEYKKIISNHATVLHLGSDYPIRDWKSLSKDIMKPTNLLPFKISEVKRMFFTNERNAIQFQAESCFRFQSNPLSSSGLCKRGKSFSRAPSGPSLSTTAVTINSLKVRDVDRLLLKHFGSSWKENERLEI